MQAIVERALAQGIRHVSDCHRLLESLIIAQDKKFVLQVISSGVKVLELATGLSSNGILRYCPSRVLIYTTSATVFLLKALFLSKAIGPDLGTCDFSTSLSVINCCIVAFRSAPIDDMDFSSRYATLIESHVARLRSCLIDDRLHSRDGDSRTVPAGNPSIDNLMNPLGGTAGNEQANIPTGATSNPTTTDWWAAPLDPTVAPFDSENPYLSMGLELDSLDFLWNMPDPYGR